MKCQNVWFRHELLLMEDYICQTLVPSLEGCMEFGEMKRKEDVPGEALVSSKQLVCIGQKCERRLNRRRHQIGRNWKAMRRLWWSSSEGH